VKHGTVENLGELILNFIIQKLKYPKFAIILTLFICYSYFIFVALSIKNFGQSNNTFCQYGGFQKLVYREVISEHFLFIGN